MNDDSFYLPPEVFQNAEFQRGIKNFISPDGKSVRFIISHDGDPMTPEGIQRIDAIKQAAKEAIKGTPLEGSKVYLAGTAATFKDMQDGSNFDLLIAGIAALCLIFIIMLIITRSVVASAVIVGTVVISLGASFGLSVLIWQHILGIELHWMVLPMAVIILLAVGADYNLLLVVPVQGGDPCRHQHRHHPRDGWHRFGGHLRGSGVRFHDDVDGGQRIDCNRAGRYYHRVSACCSTRWSCVR